MISLCVGSYTLPVTYIFNLYRPLSLIIYICSVHFGRTPSQIRVIGLTMCIEPDHICRTHTKIDYRLHVNREDIIFKVNDYLINNQKKLYRFKLMEIR